MYRSNVVPCYIFSSVYIIYDISLDPAFENGVHPLTQSISEYMHLKVGIHPESTD
jgi:hypothetical protein